MVPIQGWLERIQRQYRVRGFGDALDPARAPSVDGRTDVVRGRDATLLDGALEHEIEHVEVDANDHVHGFGQEGAFQPLQQPEKARAAQERILEAIDVQRFQGGKRVKALREHRLATDADEFDIFRSVPNRGHEPPTEDVAGRLACDDPDFHRTPALSRPTACGRRPHRLEPEISRSARVTAYRDFAQRNLAATACGRIYCRRRSRTMPCSEASMEPTKHATSATSAAIGWSSRKASASVRPRR